VGQFTPFPFPTIPAVFFVKDMLIAVHFYGIESLKDFCSFHISSYLPHTTKTLENTSICLIMPDLDRSDAARVRVFYLYNFDE